MKFNPIMTRSLVNISIMEDNMLEGNESFDLFVNSSSLHSKITITSPDQVTVTIVDNDCK